MHAHTHTQRAERRRFGAHYCVRTEGWREKGGRGGWEEGGRGEENGRKRRIE
jgi:hypothetical protein